MTPRCVIRCDGTTATGLGHVARCLSLAEALADAGLPPEACILRGRFDDVARELIAAAGFPSGPVPEGVPASAEAAALLDAAPGALLVVDRYGIDAAYLDALSVRAGERLVVIDDFAALPRYPGGATILNFSVAGPAYRYGGERLRILAGPTYFLARRRLRERRRRVRAGAALSSSPVARVLVAIGGRDRHDLCTRAIRAARAAQPDLAIHAVLGFADEADVARVRAALPPPPTGTLDLRLPDLASAYASADACISGGGLTKYEAAFFGLPVAVLSQTGEQQRETEDCVAAGFAFDLGYLPEDAALQVRLATFLSDAALRARLTTAAAGLFGDDPTLHAARAILTLAEDAARGAA